MAEIKRTPGYVADFLSQTLGVEKSRELIQSECAVRGFGEEIDQTQALLILEDLAQQPGIVGVTARFAKSRLILQWSKRP